MTDTPIEPALTETGWKRMEYEPQEYWTVKIRLTQEYGDGDLALEVVTPADFVLHPKDLPALIALANAALPDTDQRKIKRHDVDLLRSAVDRIKAGVSGDTLDDKFARVGLFRLDSLAAALESYLPPE